MAGRECFHCKQWIEERETHDCCPPSRPGLSAGRFGETSRRSASESSREGGWTTTEAALTQDLSEDLRDAWERLRETAAGFGDQRIYASHSSIMFSRKACYFFVRPKRSFLEVVFFLGRTLRSPRVRQTVDASRAKVAHIVRVTHRDEVEPPLTDWLQEAYDVSETLSARAPKPRRASRPKKKSDRARRRR